MTFERRLTMLAVAMAGIAFQPAHAANQPPAACFNATPSTGVVGTTFAFNADCSTDDHTPLGSLKFRWDWENDGTWDTAFGSSPLASHAYTTEGRKTIAVGVKDQSGLIGTTTRAVDVQPGIQQYTPGEIPPGGAGEPDVAVDPLSAQRIVVSGYGNADFSVGAVSQNVLRSTNGGSTWAQSTGLGPAIGGDDNIEFDSTGRVFLSSGKADGAGGPPMGIMVARSPDGGQVFNPPIYTMDINTLFKFPDGVSRSICDPVHPFFDLPKLAIDRSLTSPYRDRIYSFALGLHFDPNDNGVCAFPAGTFIRSLDGGLTWGNGLALPEIYQMPGQIAVGANGNVYVPFAIFGTPSICATGTGIALRKSTDGGTNFQAVTCPMTSDPDSFLTGSPWIAAHPTDPNKLYIAFAAGPRFSAVAHVYVIRSSDGGTTWSAPARVDDVLADDSVSHGYPTISVSTNGRVDLAWGDYRNSTPKTVVNDFQPGDVYYSYSTDGGLTWAPDLRLSTVTATFLGQGNDYLTATSSGLKAHVAFGQDRGADGRIEIYMTTLVFH